MTRYNKFKILFILLTTYTGINITAQQARSYIDIWGGSGYSVLLNSIADTRVKGGVGFNIGAGYELNTNKLILKTGLEFMSLNSSMKINDFTTSQNWTWNPGVSDPVELTYNYSFYKYKDIQHLGYLNIPISAGIRFDKYYFLLGGKFGLNLYGNYKSKGYFSTTVTDEQLIDDMEEMPNHYIAEGTEVKSKGPLKFKSNISTTIEAGRYLDDLIYGTRRRRKAPRTSYRAGLFLDYGISDIQKNATTQNILGYPAEGPTDPLDVQAASIMSSNRADGKSIHSLILGAKFTVLFQVSKDKKPKPKPKPRPVTTPVQPKPKPPVVPAASPERLFVAHIIDADTKANLDAEFEMIETKTKKLVYKTVSDKNTGLVSKSLLSTAYHISVKRQGYIYAQDSINAIGKDTLLIALQSIKKNTKVILQNLFFDLNSATIQSRSENSLEELYQFLVNNPNVRIAIIGHTDNLGTKSYNLRLSENRAKAVYDVLIKKGIDTSRITFNGKGDSEPIRSNDTEEGRASNRRVEFTIL